LTEPHVPPEDPTVRDPDVLERVLPESLVLRALFEQFPDVTWELSLGQDVARVPRGTWMEFGSAVKDAGFETCVDVTAVDWMRQRPERFKVVANLLSIQHRLRLRMITTAPREEPTVASLVPIWPGANFAEREAFDMFGIVFEGHPDLTRILMPDDWDGYPLRKDFGVGSVPVQFKESHKVS